jgi:F-type H+-transporting ATPase subunit b
MTISALLAASESLPVVDIDNTIFLQAILFAALFVLLNVFLFRPWLEIRERRSQKIGGALADAVSLRKQADDSAADYETRLAKAREDAVALRSDSRRGAEQEEAEIVGTARREAAAQLDAHKQTLEQQASAARAELAGRVDALASEVSQRILGRPA